MKTISTLGTKVTRRRFVGGSAMAAGGLVVGFHVPFGSKAMAQAASLAAAAGTAPGTGPDIAPEINAWVVVRPDDAVVIRVVRTEMGRAP